MRIAICVGSLNVGGVAAFCDVLVRGLTKAGHDVSILTTYSKGNFFDEARSLGWPVKNTSLGSRRLGERLKSVFDYLRKDHDVVILNHALEAQLAIPALPPRTIVIAVQHNAFERSIRKNTWNSSRYDAWVGVGPTVYNAIKHVVEEFHELVGVRMVANGVNVLTDSTRSQAVGRKLSMLYVGRIERRTKNVMILPNISAEVKAMGLDNHLTIAGDGPDLSRLKRKIRWLRMTDSIHCVGRVSKKMVHELMTDSDFVLMPSFSEGLPYTLLEAMGAHTIPITSDIPELAEVLGDSARFLVAPANDVKRYAELIAALARDAPLAGMIRRDLAERQRTGFSEESCVRGYVTVIEGCLNAKTEDTHASVPYDELVFPIWVRIKLTRIWSVAQAVKRSVGRAVRYVWQ